MPTYFLGQYETRQYSDDNGVPLAGGRVASYLSGTSTPTPTYADAIGTPNPHPVVLDSAGRCVIYLDTALTYKFLITDAAGVTIETVDPINPLPLVTPGNIFTVGPGSAAFPGFTFTGDENTGLYGPSADILAVTTGGVERARWGPTGGMNVGGTTDPGPTNLRVEGTLQVGGLADLGALTVAGPATFNGGIVGTLSATGLTVTTLGVNGVATIASLTVSGNTTLNHDLNVGGATTLQGPLGVNGLATMPSLYVSGNTSIGTDLTVTGSATVGGTFGVTGLATLASLLVTGNETVQGAFAVNGLATIASLQVTSSESIGGTLGVTGATTLSTLAVSGTSTLTGAVRIGSTNLTDAVATPTLAGGWAAGTTIAGRDYAFTITIGPNASLAGTVTFNATYANPPSCVGSCDSAAAGAVLTAATTTQVTIAPTTGPWPPGTKIAMLCRGY